MIAEELGFFGVLLVIALFAWLVGCGLRIGLRALERGQRFGGYCAFGVSLMLAIQALVSIGVNLGVLPTKGLTLPLIRLGRIERADDLRGHRIAGARQLRIDPRRRRGSASVSSPESPGEAE